MNMNTEELKQLEWLGKILKQLRKESRLNLKQVSERTGIPCSSINGYELGKVNPSATRLMTLLECYSIHIIPLLINGEQWLNISGVDEATAIRLKSLLLKSKNLKKYK